jgi:hypothetical protein
MAFWKGLLDKVAQKKEELEDEARRRAAKKAAEVALDTGKAAAKAAVMNAGKTLDYAGKKLEEALFGEATSDDEASSPATKAASERPDPFAKLKADEAARSAADRKEKETQKAREDARARTEREVDDELAALKRRIRGG